MGGELTVDTAYGKVAGIPAGTGVAFKGIPYGASTSGRARFLRPAEPLAWTGVRDACSFGPAAPQVGIAGAADGLWKDLAFAMYPDTGGPVGAGVDMDEGCLVLNIWTPAIDTTKRPVMVWLHGGAFVSGTGSEPWFDGDNLANRSDVVVVTVNHRLGLLGFLDLASIAPDRFEGAGVAGMLDIIAALRWVAENISAFGGDAGNVTIFGQSGGGAKVGTLMAMPEAAGLFHKAIIQSSPALRAIDPEEGARLAADVLAELDLRPDQVEQLCELPVGAVLGAQEALMQRAGPLAGAMLVGPVIDARHLPSSPFEPSAPAQAAAVPLLIGTNVDEMAMFLCMDPEFGRLTDDGVRARLQLVFDDRVDDVLSVYRGNHPDATPTRLLTRIMSDSWMRVPSVTLAERKLGSATAPVFMYLFTYETPAVGGVLGSCHSLELAFVFDTVDRIPFAGDRADRFAVAAAMRDAWAAFARNGEPTHEAIPAWRPYDLDTRSTMLIDVAWSLEDAPFDDERQLAASGSFSFG